MAVPKRKMSRSNTRSRRSQWKATVPTLADLPEPCLRPAEAAARGVPELRAVQGPPGRRSLIRRARRIGGVSGDTGSGAHNSPDPVVVNAALGVELGDELVVLALTHRSYAYENGGLPTNERLEFLGRLGPRRDHHRFAVPHPPDPAGGSAGQAAGLVVNMHALAGVGRGIGLGEQLRLGRGEELTGGRDKASIVADAVEAVIGAVYLEHGLDDGP